MSALFTRPGQDVLELPTSTSELGWRAAVSGHRGAATVTRLQVRSRGLKWVRWTSTSSFTASMTEVDPPTRFALDAQPGDRVGFLDQGLAFTPDHPHDWTLSMAARASAIPSLSLASCAVSWSCDRRDPHRRRSPELYHRRAWRSVGSIAMSSPQAPARPGELPFVRSRRRLCPMVRCTRTQSASPRWQPERVDTSSRGGCRSAMWILLAIGVTGDLRPAERGGGPG